MNETIKQQYIDTNTGMITTVEFESLKEYHDYEERRLEDNYREATENLKNFIAIILLPYNILRLIIRSIIKFFRKEQKNDRD